MGCRPSAPKVRCWCLRRVQASHEGFWYKVCFVFVFLLWPTWVKVYWHEFGRLCQGASEPVFLSCSDPLCSSRRDVDGLSKDSLQINDRNLTHGLNGLQHHLDYCLPWQHFWLQIPRPFRQGYPSTCYGNYSTRLRILDPRGTSPQVRRTYNTPW